MLANFGISLGGKKGMTLKRNHPEKVTPRFKITKL